MLTFCISHSIPGFDLKSFGLRQNFRISQKKMDSFYFAIIGKSMTVGRSLILPLNLQN